MNFETIEESFISFRSIDVSGNYLRFNRIAPADEGRYVCTASNRYGNTTKVAEVIVNSTHKSLFNELRLKFSVFQLTHQLMKQLDVQRKLMRVTQFH